MLLLTLIYFLATSWANAEEKTPLTFVRDGKAVAQIVLPDNATRAAQLAALEIQAHVRLITGASLAIVPKETDASPIHLFVGESDATRALGLKSSDFKPQEYLVHFTPNAVVLIGHDKQGPGNVNYAFLPTPGMERSWPGLWDDRGTLDAAYEFLQSSCGVRWLNPTEYGTMATQRSTLTVTPNDIRRQPFMRFRGGAAVTYGQIETYQDGGGLWRGGTPGAVSYNTAAFPSAYAEQTDVAKIESSRSVQTRRTRNYLFMLRMRAGGEKVECNHSFYDYYDRFWKQNPKNTKAFIEHRPDYFAKGFDGDQPPQLCYSNPETIKQVVSDIRTYFDKGGTKWGEQNYALEPMDNGSYCRCPDCIKQYELNRVPPERHSTYWFRFVKTVADEIKKTHPDKMISTLAYASHEGLPTGVILPDNVAVHFCISANRMPYDFEGLAEQMDRLKKWRDKVPNDLYLWLYHTFPREIADNGRFFCFPGYFAHELKKQFDLFRQMKIRGIFHCGFTDEVENYLSYKLMDDPSLNVDSVLNEYFSQYGPAAESMLKFYSMVEQRYCNRSNYPLLPGGLPYRGHQTPEAAWEYLGTPQFMKELAALIAEAEVKATSSPYRERVNLWKLAVWSYMNAGYEHHAQRKAAPIPELTVARVSAAGGDVNRVVWENATPLGSAWYDRGGVTQSKRTFGGRICHDGEYLYLELTDAVDPAKLEASPMVFACDVWEILLARQRAQPYRQYAVGPTGMTRTLSWGEINWRQGVAMEESGIVAARQEEPSRWVMRMRWPLASAVEKPVKPGETLYMNILRVSNNKISEGLYGIDTWVSYCTVREVDRLGCLRLAP